MAGNESITKLFSGGEALTGSELAIHDFILESFNDIGASLSHDFSKTCAFCEGLNPHDVVIGRHIKGGTILAPSAIGGAVTGEDATKELALGAYDKDSTWTRAPNVALSIGFQPIW